MMLKLIYRSLIVFSYLLYFAPVHLQAQDALWQPVGSVESKNLGKSQIDTKAGNLQKIDLASLKASLQGIPSGKAFEAKYTNTLIQLPMPNGELMPFRVIESSILSPELAKKLPQVRTYAGEALHDARIHARMDITQHGFHAIIFRPEGTVYIDPYQKGNTTHYLVYWKKDFVSSQKNTLNEGCQVENKNQKNHHQEESNATNAQVKSGIAARPSGTELRTYRLAVAATGEYTQFHNDGNASNGTAVEDAQAAIITTFNRVTGIYEKEVAVSFILVDNSSIVFEDGPTDPFSNNNAGMLINQSQDVIDSNIGFNNYDIGHTVSTGGGGLAGLGVVCTSSKARGITGSGQPIGDPYDVDYVAHEVGHQFGGPHTFNGNTGACVGGNRSGDSAYEPGSGTTIMAYAGICNPQNIQNNSDDYFHTQSFDAILNHTLNGAGNNCPATNNTGNTPPVVSVPASGFTIPINTPFALTGSASDADGDAISYAWEQFDLGPTGAPDSPSGNAPIFRSFRAVESPTRTFPRLEDIINNAQTIGEILPSYTRNLHFRLTARDNQAVGGVNYASMSFNVSNTAGPFLVTAPNTALTWEAGSSQKITWEVANTDKAPVNCQKVNILLSLDGGFTYPITLASDVANSGAHWIAVPNQATSQARIKIEAADNVFFDISNQNFTINAASAPTFTLVANPARALSCAPAGVSYEIFIGSILGFADAVTLSTDNLPSALNASFAQNPLVPEGSTTLTLSNTAALSTGNYSFSIVAVSGATTRSILVNLVLVNGNPEVAVLHTPANTAVDVSINTLFNWTDAEGSASYLLEVATDVNFTNIVLQEIIFSSSFEPNTPLASNTMYYWRVRTNNPCGGFSQSEVASFTTFNSTCITYTGTDLPIAISDGSPNTINSIINITDNFQIIDVNLINISGTHTWISDLTFTLISPSGTEVILMAQPCEDEENFNIGFDDEALSADYPCPPVDGNTYKAFENLAVFIGENSAGNWTLRVSDGLNFDGGSLDSWTLELCSAEDGNTAPLITQNQRLLRSPGAESYTLSNTQLQATDAEDEDGSLIYVIEQTPIRGSLKRNNQTLEVGSVFTQSELNNAQISYHPNTTNASQNDSFRFRVRDSGNLSTASNTFNISLDYPPVLIINEPLIDIPVRNRYLITQALLKASDAEDNSNLLNYVITQVPQQGILSVQSFEVFQGNAFSQNSINSAAVAYVPNLSENSTQDSFKFRLRDSAGNETEEFTFIINIDIVNNLSSNLLQAGTQVSPNPSEGVFKVDLDFPYQGNISLDVLSVEGKLLKELSIEKTTISTAISLDLSYLAAGVYFLRIRSSEAISTKRLMKK